MSTITNIAGGPGSSIKMADSASLTGGSGTELGAFESVKIEWTPKEIGYNDGQTTYINGDGVLEAVVLETDSSSLSTHRGGRVTEQMFEITSSIGDVYRTAVMTVTNKLTRLDGDKDMNLLKATKNTPESEDFIYQIA